MSSRQKSRLIAVQAIYAKLIDNQQNIEDIIDNEISNNLSSDKYKGFIRDIVISALDNEESIELIIKKYLKPHRREEDLQPLIKAILLAAFAEIFKEDTPNKVIVNEYIEVSSNFFDKKEYGFINAILDKYIKEYHQE
jgi:N utilization substance protein B